MDRDFFIKSLALIQERTKKLSEVSPFVRFFFVADHDLIVNPRLYTHEKMGTSKETAHTALLFAKQIVTSLPEEDWSLETIKSTFLTHISEQQYKNGFILYPLRVALSGEEFSPGTFELIEIFGKSKTVARIDNALAQL